MVWLEISAVQYKFIKLSLKAVVNIQNKTCSTACFNFNQILFYFCPRFKSK